MIPFIFPRTMLFLEEFHSPQSEGIQRQKEFTKSWLRICTDEGSGLHERIMSLAGLIQPLPISYIVLDDISMDFIIGLPKSRGFDAILVLADLIALLIDSKLA